MASFPLADSRFSLIDGLEMLSLIFHPVSSFILGVFMALLVTSLVLSSCSGPNDSAQVVANYQSAILQADSKGLEPGTPEEKAALERFTNFLKNVGNKDYLEKETAKTYAQGAFLDDTIVTHNGPEEIQQYFIQTAATMTKFELTILDTARSGSDYYIRWKMIFAAPKLSKGSPIHSVGMSQVRFNSKGQVTFHQDFWDSGKNIYGHIPVVGGLIKIIRNRMK